MRQTGDQPVIGEYSCELVDKGDRRSNKMGFCKPVAKRDQHGIKPMLLPLTQKADQHVAVSCLDGVLQLAERCGQLVIGASSGAIADKGDQHDVGIGSSRLAVKDDRYVVEALLPKLTKKASKHDALPDSDGILETSNRSDRMVTRTSSCGSAENSDQLAVGGGFSRLADKGDQNVIKSVLPTLTENDQSAVPNSEDVC